MSDATKVWRGEARDSTVFSYVFWSQSFRSQSFGLSLAVSVFWSQSFGRTAVSSLTSLSLGLSLFGLSLVSSLTSLSLGLSLGLSLFGLSLGLAVSVFWSQSRRLSLLVSVVWMHSTRASRPSHEIRWRRDSLVGIPSDLLFRSSNGCRVE